MLWDKLTITLVVASTAIIASAQEPVKGYPSGVSEVSYVSAGDNTSQKALFWKPEKEGKVPLLVGLHTWSGGYNQAGGEAVYARWCQQVGWAFIHPNFRGPNKTPDSMGSDLAVADIESCVEWAKKQVDIDETRIYAVGVSGGGHASMLVAGRLPQLWAGVSAWCGISDIAAWHAETTAAGRGNYAKNIETALGGKPEKGSPEAEDALKRSPVTYLAEASDVPLDINHGIEDGRKGSVPFTHSLNGWNAVVPADHRISPELVERYYEMQSIPGELTRFRVETGDELYGKRQPLFRMIHQNTRLTLFDGGHEIVHVAALNWLSAQRKGTPAVWGISDPVKLSTSNTDSESGK